MAAAMASRSSSRWTAPAECPVSRSVPTTRCRSGRESSRQCGSRIGHFLPHEREADGVVPKVGPPGLERNPAVVDETLAHLDEREMRRTRRRDVITKEMDVRLD